MPDEWDWGQDEDKFPTEAISQPIETYEFQYPPSDDTGDSRVLQARVHPDLGRQIDELLVVLRSKGINLMTPSDFVRWCCFRGMSQLVAHLNLQHKEIETFLVTSRQLLVHTLNSERLKDVKVSVRRFISGMEVLNRAGEFKELQIRIVEFLSTMSVLAGSQDFILKLYLRELFENQNFLEFLKGIHGSNIDIDVVIVNAEQGYKRMMEIDD